MKRKHQRIHIPMYIYKNTINIIKIYIERERDRPQLPEQSNRENEV